MSKVLGPKEYDLQTKYKAEDGHVFMSGVQALVRVPIDQLRYDRTHGLKTAVFASGYPGSPLGGFDMELARERSRIEDHRIVHIPGLNEDLAATAVMGSQVSHTFPDSTYDGVIGIWYGKAPGLDRSGDAIRHAQFAGVSPHGGVLLYVGDDPGSKSSTLPSASEWTLRDLELPVLSPGSIQEVLDLGRHGIAMSRFSGLWVAMKVVASVADGVSTVSVATDRITPVVPKFEWNGVPFEPSLTGMIGPPASRETEPEIYGPRIEAARAYGAANKLNEVTVSTSSDRLGLVAGGQTYYELLEALEKLGVPLNVLGELGIRVFHLRMLYPLDGVQVRDFARGLDEIFVIEEKRPFVEQSFRDILYGTQGAPAIIGKRDKSGQRLLAASGTLDADRLLEPLANQLARFIDPNRMLSRKKKRTLVPLLEVTRNPYFCAGCPHNTSTRVPEGTLVGAGIGCHGMAMTMDPTQVGHIVSSTHMGGEGAQWIGIEPFVDSTHIFQNMGDGTFFHSGQLAIQAAVAAGSHITYKLLYNSAVAMTGGQDTKMSNGRPVSDIAETMLRQGVSRVIITSEDTRRYRRVKLSPKINVWDRSRIIEAQIALAKLPGVTVLIHDQECAAELRRKRKRGTVPEPSRRIVINERVCEGCGDCGVVSNCLAVEPIDTEFGRKTTINQSSCNKDYSCLDGNCPSFLTVVLKPAKKRSSRSQDPNPQKSEEQWPEFIPQKLSEPTASIDLDDVKIQMPGIGGTGVVTVNQILGTAALLEGRTVSGLDQTGMSQKAGPVVSNLRISTHPSIHTGKASSDDVDVLLAFDLVVALSSSNLDSLKPSRTVVVASSSVTPTGEMISHVDAPRTDLGAMTDLLKENVDVDRIDLVDMLGISEGLFGTTVPANLFLVGIAYQRGYLPVTARSIERAIELNGVAVRLNNAAFNWGRMWVVDPAEVIAKSIHTLERTTPSAADVALVRGLVESGPLFDALLIRVPDLVKYQNRSYAERYLNEVSYALAAERRIGVECHDFSLVVARNLYKLMAYKDEYEVARLHLEKAATSKVQGDVGPDVKVYWNLQPPLFKSMGMKKKISLGPWFRPAFKVLQASRRLRGSAFDPFGRTDIRRTERALIDEYVADLRDICNCLSSENIPIATHWAGLPDLIRGYEEIKASNVAKYRQQSDQVLSQLAVNNRYGTIQP
jgi:indolepyruvate ferredoxin oxidoreductase